MWPTALFNNRPDIAGHSLMFVACCLISHLVQDADRYCTGAIVQVHSVVNLLCRLATDKVKIKSVSSMQRNLRHSCQTLNNLFCMGACTNKQLLFTMVNEKQKKGLSSGSGDSSSVDVSQ